jgi:uncharacterized protein
VERNQLHHDIHFPYKWVYFEYYIHHAVRKFTFMKIDATWDPNKALANERKHEGIRFGDAATVLADPLALSVFDASHSDNEERWFTLGRTREGQLLAVSHTFIEPDTASEGAHTDIVRVRIISARAATRRERMQYEEAAR